jgi:hypothetical protein
MTVYFASLRFVAQYTFMRSACVLLCATRRRSRFEAEVTGTGATALAGRPRRFCTALERFDSYVQLVAFHKQLCNRRPNRLS